MKCDCLHFLLNLIKYTSNMSYEFLRERQLYLQTDVIQTNKPCRGDYFLNSGGRRQFSSVEWSVQYLRENNIPRVAQVLDIKPKD